jgi:formate C-acetyltransferase
MKYLDLRHQLTEKIEDRKDLTVIEKKAYILAGFWLTKPLRSGKEDIMAGKINCNSNINMVPANLKSELEIHIDNGVIDNSIADIILKSAKMGMFNRSPGTHIIPAYDVLIKEGIDNRINNIHKLYKIYESDADKACFYRGEYIVLKGFQQLILRYAGKYASESDKKESVIVKTLNNIAHYPAENFREAIQMVLLAHEATVDESGCGSISFGRLDQYLYEYYKRDTNSGHLSQEEAYELIKTFWIKLSELEKSWQNVTIGGCDAEGNDLSNELTYMCMKAAKEVGKDQPQLSLRICKSTAEKTWNEAFSLMKEGLGFPSLFNDEVAIRAKINAGVSKKDAYNYGIVGCVELSSGGNEYSHTEAARINMMKLLELILNNGVCNTTGEIYPLKESRFLSDIKSYEQFYDWFKKELGNYLILVCRFLDDVSNNYGMHWPVPFTSCLMNGCIEDGHDVTVGSTVYNNLTINLVGIASIADSLEAIEKIVFYDKKISLNELRNILNSNYENYEVIRSELLASPKYGNGINSVDDKVKDLAEYITMTISNERMRHRNGKFQAGFYSSYFHATMAENTGASPDGRKKGEALSSSLSPMAGMDKSGPTGVVNSAAKVNMKKFGNGMALDLKFSKIFFDKKSHIQGLIALTKYYFEKGGLEIQFNIVGRDTLINAQKYPGKYPNLIVRVSGFSGYYVNLERTLQDEIIKRTEHGRQNV